MAKLTLNDISGGYASATAFNANFALIEAALENTLSRDGTTPNVMTADFDLNSQDLLNGNILNASSVVTAGLTLNGQAVTTTTTLTGGLAASEVTYDAGTLEDKLNDEFPKLADAETVTGAWTFNAAAIFADDLTLSGGDLAVTGNITVSGTVDGVDLANVVVVPAAVTDHIRAGNTQLINDAQGTTIFSVSSSFAASTFETIGPTGSGAQNIWADMDAAVAAGARALIVSVRVSIATSAASIGTVQLFTAEGDASPSLANQKDVSVAVSHETSAAGDTAANYSQLIIPLTAAGLFQAAWTETNSALTVVELTYKGFITD